MRAIIAGLKIDTSGAGLYEIGNEVTQWLAQSGAQRGLLTLFCQHTSAGLLITENASPAVWRDMQRWFGKLAPEGDGYEHDDEGPDDMPAHLRTVLTGNSLAVPVENGRMMLGTWQGVFLAEHRAGPHRRQVAAHFIGE